MKYEVATNQPAENKAIIARILAGQTVYGAFLRGTGKVYQQHEICVTTDEAGALVLSGGMNTHNGQIQERFSTLICEYCPACDRANEINRGAPMTDAEKAEMKRRRAIGTLAASLENWTRNVGIYEARAAQTAAYTPLAFGVAPQGQGGAGWTPEMVKVMEKKEAGYWQTKQKAYVAQHNANAADAQKEIAKLLKKQAAI